MLPSRGGGVIPEEHGGRVFDLLRIIVVRQSDGNRSRNHMNYFKRRYLLRRIAKVEAYLWIETPKREDYKEFSKFYAELRKVEYANRKMINKTCKLKDRVIRNKITLTKCDDILDDMIAGRATR